MSLLFDQNLSWRLVALLAAEYPGSEQVVAAGMSRREGPRGLGYAASKGLAVVSKDKDFRDLSDALGPPPKVIWLRVGNVPTSDIEDLLRKRQSDVLAFLANPSAAVLELP